MRQAHQRNVFVDVKKTIFTDAAGGAVTESDELVTQEWVGLRAATSKEIDEARQVGEQITHKCQMRYSDVSAAFTAKDHYLVDGSRVYEIVGTPRNLDERNAALEFEVRRRP